MAVFDPLAAADRQTVVGQLDQFLTPPPAPAAGAERATRAVSPRPADPKLAESFAAIGIGLDQVLSPPDDLVALLQPANSWVHLIHDGKKPTHLAFSRVRTTGFGPPVHKVVATLESHIGAKADEAIAWIDAKYPDDTAVVRYVSIPSYYTTAFGIVHKKRAYAVLVDQPKSFTQLKYKKRYALKEFLTLLAKERHTGSLAGA